MIRFIRDPIHDYIPIYEDEEILLKLIDTYELQRLRRISQLSFAWMVFPGATHDRFSHSLGTMHTCRLIAQRFAGDLELTEHDARIFILKACICGLLHDVGHGFCSHFFEDLLKSLGLEKPSSPLSIHAIWTQEIIKNTQIKDLISDSSFSIDKIAAIFFRKPAKETEDFFLSQIISSQLDADRLDYLDRDALYTGVRQRIDLRRIIYTLKPDEERRQILVREKGMQGLRDIW